MEASTFINENVINLLTNHVDWWCVLLVILAGLFSKRYLNDLTMVGKFKIGNAFKTLVVGSLFITVYLLLMNAAGNLHKEDYTKYFFSYCFATSAYEIILSNFHFFKKKK